MGRGAKKEHFPPKGQKKALAVGQSAPQELKKGLHGGAYLIGSGYTKVRGCVP